MRVFSKREFSKGWMTGIALGVAASVALVVSASSVTGLKTFTAGETAVAQDVNDNFTAVKTAVDDNDTRITTNATNITTNATNITTNATNITANTTNITANTTNITANTTRITALETGGGSCAGTNPSDVMVPVGPLCVDKYEASVSNTAASGGAPFGTAGDDYLCSDNGNDCSASAANPIYAHSEAGKIPASDITWFQAQQACANVGKRLLTNAEWQMAAAGNPSVCNITSGLKASTDANPACVSNWGVVNMVGNVWEWVADWVQADGTDSVMVTITGIAFPETVTSTDFDLYVNTTNTAAFGLDFMRGIGEAENSRQGSGAGFPGALLRGAAFSGDTGAGVFATEARFAPSASAPQFGFRCAR